MRGQILRYDSSTHTGVIKGEDQSSYLFARHDIHTGSEIKDGQQVDFVPSGSTATNIVILSTPADSQSAPQTTAPVAALNPFDFKTALLKFEGRLSRQNFWIGFAILYGASIILSSIPVVNIIAALALIWPNLALVVKRLHDMGKSGWLAAIPIVSGVITSITAFVTLFAFIFTVYSEDIAPASLAALVPAIVLICILSLVNLAFLIWIGVVDSQPGTNKYGPNPKGL